MGAELAQVAIFQNCPRVMRPVTYDYSGYGYIAGESQRRAVAAANKAVATRHTMRYGRG